jgi:hypothetical protein
MRNVQQACFAGLAQPGVTLVCFLACCGAAHAVWYRNLLLMQCGDAALGGAGCCCGVLPTPSALADCMCQVWRPHMAELSTQHLQVAGSGG